MSTELCGLLTISKTRRQLKGRFSRETDQKNLRVRATMVPSLPARYLRIPFAGLSLTPDTDCTSAQVPQFRGPLLATKHSCELNISFALCRDARYAAVPGSSELTFEGQPLATQFLTLERTGSLLVISAISFAVKGGSGIDSSKRTSNGGGTSATFPGCGKRLKASALPICFPGT
ncbi:hypothetical protein M514_21007 [Trichuris suis]|uniref:Uncharacterized protein n=1 Tax=Trichuris suis TaxID=68888 RepID=A0A085NBL7_9BILA|nr:hypothetical protein M514_21007 [Trichuris suis]